MKRHRVTAEEDEASGKALKVRRLRTCWAGGSKTGRTSSRKWLWNTCWDGDSGRNEEAVSVQHGEGMEVRPPQGHSVCKSSGGEE